MRIIRRHKRIAIFAVLAVFVMAGVAGAYWTQSGSGTGSASTGTTAAITVNQTSTTAGLFPGGPAQTLAGNFTNPNTSPVFVTAVTAVIPNFSVRPDNTKPACTQADFQLGGTANVGHLVGSGTGVDAWTGLTIKMLDNGLNQDNCKGVSVTINYTAS